MDGDKAINVLSKAVKGMKAGMKDVAKNVTLLKAEVFPQAPGPAPAGAAPAAAPPALRPAGKPEAKPAAKPAKFLAESTAKLPSVPGVQAPPPPPPAPAEPAEAHEDDEEAESKQVQSPKHREISVSAAAQDLAIEHVKRKASQMASGPPAIDVQQSSMGEILAAAVQGAQAQGIAVPSIMSSVPSVKALLAKPRAKATTGSPKAQAPAPKEVQVSVPQGFEIIPEASQEQGNQAADGDDDRDDAWD